MKNIHIIIGSIIAFALALAMLPPSAFAITYCINNTWIATNTTIYDTNTGASIIAWSIPDRCPYGCDAVLNQCRQPQYNMWLGPVAGFGILGLIIFIVLVILIIHKLSK